MTFQLIDTTTASDGKRRLCLLLRDDGFFQYRIDRLVEDDDAFEAYWRDGYPLSGLFATQAEAQSAGDKEFRPSNPSSAAI